MLKRLWLWIVRLALEIDKDVAFVVCWVFSFPTYVLLGRGGLPRTDRSISGLFGEYAAAGWTWARLGQSVINFLFRNPNHCFNAISGDDND